MLVDPAVNMVFQKMKTQLSDYREKLDQAQSDLSAWKFTPDRSASALGLASRLQAPNSMTHSFITSHERNKTHCSVQLYVDCICNACTFRTVCVCKMFVCMSFCIEGVVTERACVCVLHAELDVHVLSCVEGWTGRLN